MSFHSVQLLTSLASLPGNISFPDLSHPLNSQRPQLLLLSSSVPKMNADEGFEMQHRGKSGQEIRQNSDSNAELGTSTVPDNTEDSKVPSRQLDVSRLGNHHQVVKLTSPRNTSTSCLPSHSARTRKRHGRAWLSPSLPDYSMADQYVSANTTSFQILTSADLPCLRRPSLLARQSGSRG